MTGHPTEVSGPMFIIIIIIIMGFAVAFPRGGSSSTVSRSNWNLVVLVFDERGKPEHPEKKPLGAE